MRSVLLALLAVAAPALAQTPQPAPGTVTAEATEVVRVKPDQAKVYVTAAGRNPDATAAQEEAAEVAKKFTDEVTRMKLNGLKATADPVKVAKQVDERASALRGGGGFGGAGGGPPLGT